MKKKTMKLMAAALMGMLAIPQPTMADDYPVTINGSLINWYYYGRDIHSGEQGWHQQNTGLGTADNPYNYGLISLGADPTAEDNKPVWVADFPIRNHIFFSNAGGVYTGDAYYSFFMSEQGWEDNMESEYGSETYLVKVRKWTWDEGYANVAYTQVATMTTQPIDLTYDPLYDRVYGIFYNGNGYKLGILDMETFQVTNISKEAYVYGAPKCIACNSKGELYTIDASGNVCRADKTTGELTTIGNVGFKSQDRMMSATFDLRNDKLYWVGFCNDGKIPGASGAGTNEKLSVADGGRDTGIYEVNTETGAATLIGKTDFADVDITDPLNPIVNKYGKMQLTGIYVDGCFTKKAIDQCIEILSAPAQVKAGEEAKVTVRVKNIGLEKVLAKNYVVNLYVNGQVVATIDRDHETTPVDNLEKGASQTIDIPFTAPAVAGGVTIYAEVANASDEEQRNNKTEEKSIIILGGKSLPNPVLAGNHRLNNVRLTWAAPEGHISEGGEKFAAFSYDGLNDWTMVDGDKAYTQSFNSWNDAVNYPNMHTPKAYIVFNPEQSGIYLTGSATMFIPHSGQQYFAAVWSAVPDDSELGGHQVANDDYMISPELNGKSQTISFWAKGYKGSVATGYETEANYVETMNVLYTTEAGNVDPTTYAVAKEEFQVNNEAWTLYQVELPEGAKHFALHCTSAEGFVLMIDDIEFTVAPMTVIGYSVYQNDERIADLPATTTAWSGTGAEGDKFHVTALYETGESAPSNTFLIETATGIENVERRESSVDTYYDLQGRRVTNPTKGVYIVNGVKVVKN